MIACATAFYHCYLNERGLRCAFILKHEKIILNNNIMSSFKVPTVCCYLNKTILSLKHVIQLATTLLSITNQQTFTEFFRNFKLGKSTLEGLCYELLNKGTRNKDNVLQLTGKYNYQRYVCYLSFYISENYGILFINFQNLISESKESLLNNKIIQLQGTLNNIQQLIGQYIEQRVQKSRAQLQQDCQHFVISTYSLLIQYINQEPIEEINLIQLVQHTCRCLNQASHQQFHISIDNNCKVCYSIKYHLFLLFANLITQSISNGKNDKQIFLQITPSFDIDLQVELYQVELAYRGKRIKRSEITLIEKLVLKVGIQKQLQYTRVNGLIKYSFNILSNLRLVSY